MELYVDNLLSDVLRKRGQQFCRCQIDLFYDCKVFYCGATSVTTTTLLGNIH